MAKAIDNLRLKSQSTTYAPSIRALGTLRLTIGLSIVFSALISLAGISWDIQWHTFVGRDRTLIPPHIMMLTGIALGGLLSLAAVCLETAWVRRKPQLTQYSTQFAGMFYGSLGAYIAGFAALDAGIAFPLDSYWHSLYGIDVSLWAPFHVMIGSGMAIMALGAAAMLYSARNLMQSEQRRRAAKLSAIAMLIALSLTFSFFTMFLSTALNTGNLIPLGITGLTSYPLLAGFLTAFIFATARTSGGKRFNATLVILFYIVFALIFSTFVPPATNLLVTQEQLQYRRALDAYAYLSIVAVSMWGLLPILIAPVYDLVARQLQMSSWSEQRRTWTYAILASLAGIPVFILNPTAILKLISHIGSSGLCLSLLIGVLASYAGTLLGQRTGEILCLGENESIVELRTDEMLRQGNDAE